MSGEEFPAQKEVTILRDFAIVILRSWFCDRDFAGEPRDHGWSRPSSTIQMPRTPSNRSSSAVIKSIPRFQPPTHSPAAVRPPVPDAWIVLSW